MMQYFNSPSCSLPKIFIKFGGGEFSILLWKRAILLPEPPYDSSNYEPRKMSTVDPPRCKIRTRKWVNYDKNEGTHTHSYGDHVNMS